MVGGLVLPHSQHQVATPRTTAAPAPSTQALEQAPCCTTVSARGGLDEVRKAHARHVKLGLDRSPRHARPLLAACALGDWPGSMQYAAAIFATLDDPEAFDYNTLMRGHVVGARDPAAALRLYVDMLHNGVDPDGYTFPFVLKACAQLAASRQGRQLQGHATKLGFSRHNEHVQNSLISFYGKCGEAELARRAFEQMEAGERTAASWSALLAAYTRAGLWAECLEAFGAMARDGWRPDESSMVSALSACAHLGAYDVGRSVHCALLRNTARLNTFMETSMVDMYAKCGCIEKATAVFDGMGGGKNVWTYSAMVSGLALHGDGRKALQVFDAMVSEGHRPDEAVYVGVLNACSRSGLLDEGLRCFDRMRLEHIVAPNAQHYGCMVDLLARAGRLEEARALIGNMPTGPTDSAWRSLLNACRIHGDIEHAERALRELARLGGAANAGDYIIVADMHASAKNWDAAAALRVQAVDRGLAQAQGLSAVEVHGRMHRFVSQDRSHPRTADIYEMLHQMEWQLRFEGYKPDTTDVALDVNDEEKLRAVAAHSQKLAMAFGLLSTPEGTPVRVVTNLRMSKECHAYSALISEIFGREVVVRDRNRFHRFRRGACSCGNYW
ncbi:pentatricopeptide repeat-containing protein At1g31920 [Lolium rigidum]|uniref:pentatricopeptide repeat-containing protein At1g31920 n=1 Tax=Lolium rigidum TaxID=89674 RepID=UPI001F5CDF30|nr:pentatricopeptide repeat-containing protein At1g31920 [Lolium rigidum]